VQPDFDRNCRAIGHVLLTVGRLLILGGFILVVVGVVVMIAEQAGIRLGSLPGDIRMQGRRGTFYFPVVTCLVISAVLSLLAWLFSRR